MIYVFFFLLVVFIAGISNKIEVTHTYIKSSKIKNEIKFAVIGDLHSCFYGEKMEKIVDVLKKENVDFILNVGDMYDKRVNIKNSDKYFEEIQTFKSFFISGNHDLHKRNDLIYKKTVSKFNTVVLEGKRRSLTIKDTKINIVGTDDIQIGKKINTQLKRGFKDIDQNFTVLMFHRPHCVDIFKKYPCDLIVSGHAHGGQWIIPFTKRGIFAPQQGLFPKYTNGLYKINEKLLYVTRGLAVESVMIPRLYNRPEIAIIHLLPQ